jgi:hypothetical protein
MISELFKPRASNTASPFRTAMSSWSSPPLEQLTGRYRPKDFALDALRADLSHDTRILRQMLRLVEPLPAARDTKLRP